MDRRTPKGQNARTHGLTSRALPDAQTAAADILAKALIEGCCATPDLRDAAWHLALMFIRVDIIRREIFAEINRISPPDMPVALHPRGKVDKIKISVDRELAHMKEVLLTPQRKLQTLQSYERKALSRLDKAIRRLDYLMIEAARLDFGRGKGGLTS